MFDRRQFLAQSAAGVVAAGVSRKLSRSAVAASPNEQVPVALIGLNGMGFFHLKTLARNSGCRIVALCDIDEQVRARGREEVRAAAGYDVALENDFRKLLGNSAVSAVVISTPHHWHAPIALAAIQAGKDVYVEKPASHVFREGRVLLDAARRRQRIFQHGTQMRSSPLLAQAREVLDSGVLGEIKITKAFNCQGKAPALPVPDGTPPAGVDYNLWLGPAPEHAFNANRFHKNWRLFRDYGNGDMGDDGAHDLDLARWALGVTSHPIRIAAQGSNLLEPGYREYPDNLTVRYDYPDGRAIVYEDRLFAPYGQNGVDSSNVFYGTEGYMVLSRRGFFKTYLGKEEAPGPEVGKSGRVSSPVPVHLEDFLQAVRGRGTTHADAEVAHLSNGLIHLGEIAYRTRSVLEFDPEAERITNVGSANDLLSKEYRRPFEISDAG